ncbi:hypothetical protein LTR22_009671 [Elasticomyces elasticus]|nr:hypothetical protein LTR22_009671 [Elasticomyces elasticus]KAK4921564.1 hypothetical protein LTR49_011034 [Elasticomyces elasticus]KAK5760252.1 hypothetical protein LTS12_009636 [Elasticomyces elasticus]
MNSTPTFFRLPQELRDEIYRLVVTISRPIWYSLEEHTWAKPPESHQYLIKGSEQPALSRTCRALREGVLSVYYGENKIYVNLEADAYHRIPLERSGDWCGAHPSFLALRQYRLQNLFMIVPISVPPGFHPLYNPDSAMLGLSSEGRGGPLKLVVDGLLAARCCCRMHDYVRDLNAHASVALPGEHDRRIYDFVRWMAEFTVPLLVRYHEPGNGCPSCGKARSKEEDGVVEPTEDCVYINGLSPATGDDYMPLKIGSWWLQSAPLLAAVKYTKNITVDLHA